MSFLLVAVVAGIVLGVLRAFIVLAFGPRALAFADTAFLVLCAAACFAHTEAFWGTVLLVLAGINSTGFLPKKEVKKS